MNDVHPDLYPEPSALVQNRYNLVYPWGQRLW